MLCLFSLENTHGEKKERHNTFLTLVLHKHLYVGWVDIQILNTECIKKRKTGRKVP